MIWLQEAMGSVGRVAAQTFTFFGEELVLILVLGFIYWCYDKKFGEYLGINLIFALIWNTMIKNIVVRRRPYFDNAEVECLKAVDSGEDIYDISAQGYSFPSGHSTNSIILYGLIGKNMKKPFLRAVAFAIPLFVGISRICLGVHYPTDVVAGWVLGGISMLAVSFLQRKIKDKRILYGIILVTSLPGCLFCRSNDYYSCLGIMIGFFAGSLFEEKFVKFENTRNAIRVIIRMVCGVAVFAVINSVLKTLFSDEFLSSATNGAYAFRTLRYAVSVFAIIGLYPIIFKKCDRIFVKK